MSKLKLTYFDFSGSRGEECRLALFLNGVEFEDNRIKVGDWPALKPTTPYGSMPLLERPGSPVLAQSCAILAFIGREYGLHPKDAWEAARHEGVMQAVEDLRAAVATTGDTKDEDEKRRRREAFTSGYLQRWAASIEAQIEGPYFAGADLHLADIKLFVILSALLSNTYEHMDAPAALKSYPKLLALHQAVSAHPKVVEWRSRKH